MQRPSSFTSSLIIGLTVLMLGSITTASKAEGETGALQQPAPSSSSQASSSAEQLGLSRHLKTVGAKFYGAWWCPACSKQKSLFGAKAAAELPYIECDQQAEDRERCSAAQIKAFPTWDLNGKERLVGVQSLDELSRWSDYKPSGQSKP